MNDANLTRRRLLRGIGSASLATVLPGCSSGPSTAPAPSPGPDLRRKIASLLVVGFRGETLDDNDWIMKAVRDGLGGVILFDRDQQTGERRNITSPGQVTALVKALRKASPGRLIVSIDQEGGRIARLNPDNGFPP
ncbi:MAG TPA: hypothetical protein VFX60_18020 [Micromonospora sp.]|nr:hypothetical protein [Micromonospora sp.]